MLRSSFYSIRELIKLGVNLVGKKQKNIFVSRNTSIYNPKKLYIADNVRIDDFTILSGKGDINIGNYVHISSSVLLTSGKYINIGDFVGISSGTKLFGSNDDYSGHYLVGPTVPTEYTNVTSDIIDLHKHALIGSQSLILPGVTIKKGGVLGAMSLLKSDIGEFEIFVGNPAKMVKKRQKTLELLEIDLVNKQSSC